MVHCTFLSRYYTSDPLKMELASVHTNNQLCLGWIRWRMQGEENLQCACWKRTDRPRCAGQSHTWWTGRGQRSWLQHASGILPSAALWYAHSSVYDQVRLHCKANDNAALSTACRNRPARINDIIAGCMLLGGDSILANSIPPDDRHISARCQHGI